MGSRMGSGSGVHLGGSLGGLDVDWAIYAPRRVSGGVQNGVQNGVHKWVLLGGPKWSYLGVIL